MKFKQGDRVKFIENNAQLNHLIGTVLDPDAYPEEPKDAGVEIQWNDDEVSCEYEKHMKEVIK